MKNAKRQHLNVVSHTQTIGGANDMSLDFVGGLIKGTPALHQSPPLPLIFFLFHCFRSNFAKVPILDLLHVLFLIF
jgi:hypothetical protein